MKRKHWRRPFVSLCPAPVNFFGAVFEVYACTNIHGLEVKDPIDDEDLHALMQDPHIEVAIKSSDFQ